MTGTAEHPGTPDVLLVERDTELRAVRAAVDGLLAGRPAVVMVEGPPGSGRSAVLRDAVARARAAGCAVPVAHGSPAEADLPRGVVSQLLVRLGPEADREVSTTPLPGLCQPFLAAARERPLLLAVDDVQWCDPQSRQWLESMLRRVRHVPMAILVAGTSGTLPLTGPGTAGRATGARAGAPDTTRLRLRPLTRDGVAAVLATACGGPAEEELVDAAAAACEGSPAVLHSVLETLRADGLAPTAARLPGLAAECVQARTARQVDGLSAELTALLRVIAVCGPHLGPAELGDLAGLHTLSAGPALRRLARSGLVLDGDHPRAPKSVADCVLAGMTHQERTALHTRAAVFGHRAALPESTLAELLLGAPPDGADWAVAALAGSAARCRTTDPDRAVRYLERALAEPLDVHGRSHLLVDRGAASVTGTPDSGDHSLWGVLSSPDHGVPHTARLRAADLLTAWGNAATVRHGTALAWARPGAEDAERAAYQALYWLIEDAAPREEAVDIPLVAPLPEEPRGPAQTGALALRTALTMALPPGRVRELARTALCHVPGHPRLFTVRLASCFTLGLADAYDDAMAHLDDIVAEARTEGIRTAVVAALNIRAAVALRRGWLEETERDLAEIAWATPTGSAPVKTRPLAVALRVMLHLERNEVDDARLAAAADLPARSVNGLWWPMFLYARGRLGLRTGDHQAALADLSECGQSLLSRGWRNPAVVPWRAAAAAARLGCGDRPGAERLAAAEHAAAETWGTRSARGNGLLALALAAGGDRARAARAEAARLLAEDPPPEWSSTRRAHRLRQLIGSPAPVLPQADTPEPRADDGCTPAGGRLTAAESRIAGLVRDGMTNTAIAEHLSVSRRMVEMHLTRTYRKLGVGGRAALRRSPAVRG
ncbi:helix-turn-helix transcriptional regulator [Streptomyces monomycini]|uniref:helix-turn-helix transcriptional regulator n=1 Tax=Streptomyces monomycini TaxID=371720 RepID=UPI0004AB8B0E|nr:helix-turn-helix transcriptional regulator [Streptomyces monomycini]